MSSPSAIPIVLEKNGMHPPGLIQLCMDAPMLFDEDDAPPLPSSAVDTGPRAGTTAVLCLVPEAVVGSPKNVSGAGTAGFK